MPEHFAERHGLIVIIALGESIVAIGVGASHTLSLGIGTAAVLGVALTAAMWWTYFDVVAIVAGRRLVEAEPGRTQNEMARDSYSYMHLVMVAGIVLVALGMKTTIGHFGDHLHAVPAFALLGGLAIYLLGHVAFRYRHVHTINRQRLLLAIVLLILRAGGDRGPGAGRARRRQRPDLGDDRLRDPPLRRGSPRGPPADRGLDWRDERAGGAGRGDRRRHVGDRRGDPYAPRRDRGLRRARAARPSRAAPGATTPTPAAPATCRPRSTPTPSRPSPTGAGPSRRRRRSAATCSTSPPSTGSPTGSGATPTCSPPIGTRTGGAGWCRTSTGEYAARVLVSATGPWSEPVIPEIPGTGELRGQGLPLLALGPRAPTRRGAEVAVIGSGASAVQFVPEIQPRVERPDRSSSAPRTGSCRSPTARSAAALVESSAAGPRPSAPCAAASTAPLRSSGWRPATRACWHRCRRRASPPPAPLGTRSRAAPHPHPRLHDRLQAAALLQRVVPGAEPAQRRCRPPRGRGGAAERGGRRRRGRAAGRHDRPRHRLHDHRPAGRRAGARTRGPQPRSRPGGGSPTGYLGSVVHGFPNFFILLGPNIGNGHSSAFVLSETQIGYMVEASAGDVAGQPGRRRGPRRRRRSASTPRSRPRLAGTVWNAGGCMSYYLDANGRNSTMFPGSTLELRRRLSRFDLADSRPWSSSGPGGRLSDDRRDSYGETKVADRGRSADRRRARRSRSCRPRSARTRRVRSSRGSAPG